MPALQARVEPHRGGRFASLDGIRAVAALGVLVYHVSGWAELTKGDGIANRFLNNLGNFGVATFFLLSGFLLYRPFVNTWFRQRPAPDPVLYLRHRFLRIFPAYWLALGSFVALGLLKNKTPTGDFWFTLFSLTQDFRNGFGFAGLSVAWTLSIEVSFYVALPFIAAGIRVLGRRAHTDRMRLEAQLLGLGIMVAVSLIYRVIVAGPYQLEGKGNVAHLWLPNYLDWFALGMLFAVLVVWSDLGHTLPSAVSRLADQDWACWLLALACYVTLMMLRDAGGATFGGGEGKETTIDMVVRFALNGLAAMFFLLPAILGRAEGTLVRALATAVPVYLGTVSYGIYLWHKLWLDWLARSAGGTGADRWPFVTMLAAVLALTLVTASASWFVLERPLMRFKDPRRIRRALEPAAVGS